MSPLYNNIFHGRHSVLACIGSLSGALLERASVLWLCWALFDAVFPFLLVLCHVQARDMRIFPSRTLLPHVYRSSGVMLSMRNKIVQLNYVFLSPCIPIMFHPDRWTHGRTNFHWMIKCMCQWPLGHALLYSEQISTVRHAVAVFTQHLVKLHH